MKRWECIAKRFDKDAKIRGVEVGVYTAKLSKQLLLLLPRLNLYMVDRWQPYSKLERKLNLKTSMCYTTLETWRIVYKKAIKKVEPFGKRAVIMKMSSKRASKKFKMRTLDFVFLDADHGYEAVKKDINRWIGKIKIGGYICGHDYYRKTVKKAIDEVFPNAEIDDDKTWFVRVK